MSGFRASEVTVKSIEDVDDLRTLKLENIHFFRSAAVFDDSEQSVSAQAAQNDRSVLKSKLGVDNFCIPTNDRKSVLEIATKIKDYECVFFFHLTMCPSR